jgi:uncharacterized damage-inducible protein DinB
MIRTNREVTAVATAPDLRATILAAWRTSNRATIYLVEQVSLKLWRAEVPATPRRTIRTIAAHLHNARCSWIRTLGQEHGISVPVRVDPHSVTRRQLVAALGRSGRSLEALLELGFANDGRVPPSKAYVWRNLPLDVGHVLSYFVAHEAHHRGQIFLLARLLGHPFPREVMGGVWQWNRLGARS